MTAIALKTSVGTTEANFAKDRLKSLIERIERLEEEKAGIAEDIRDVYGEAKSTGFDVAAMREVIRLRKLDGEARMEREELLELYKSALNMI